MSQRDSVLRLLEEKRGSFVSGEEIAASLSVSRSAVWKAVKSLQAQGIPVEAVTRLGYRLAPDADPLSRELIEKYITAGSYRLDVRNTTVSTNTDVKALAAVGEAQGLVVVSGCQTGGRGRMDRSFFSPEATGLYMSILLRPDFPAFDASLLTTAAAVAVCQAVETVSNREASIKWVNDVFCGGKKVCGILTEGAFSVETGGLDYAVLGIGVNVCAPVGGFPPEIAEIAASVFSIGEAVPDARCRLAGEILSRFHNYYVNLSSRSFFPEYKSRCFVLGRDVTVIRGETRCPARAFDLDDNLHLMVRYPDGTTEALNSGEISVKPL